MARFKLKLNDHRHVASPVLAPMQTILAVASDYYQYHLSAHVPARDYLIQRGLDDATLAKFEFGFSPNGFNQLTSQKNNRVWKSSIQRTLPSKLNDEALSSVIFDLMVASGLLRLNSRGEYSDRYRGRIVVPIKDQTGQIVSFGGRVFDSALTGENAPKYINGSDTPIFHKKDVVFGLNFIAKQGFQSSIIAVEGYLDVATMHQFGIENAVCGMGTSVTVEQLQQLFQYTDCISFCFDGDEAGRKAAMRAAVTIRPLLSGSRTATFTFLPDGEDPDTMLRGGINRYTQDYIDGQRDAFLSHIEDGLPIEGMLDYVARYQCATSWKDEPKLLMAHLLNDVVTMPVGSDVGARIQQSLRIKASKLSSTASDIDEAAMVQFIKGMN